MEMQQLRHFLAAVRHGNFAKAADDVNITQSGLSRSIKTLEDVLGLPVLVRNARGVEATKFGAALVPYAKAILNERERALEKLFAIRQHHLGSVRLGVTPNFAHHFVPDAIAQFLMTQPNVDVWVKMDNFPNLVEQINAAEFDAILVLRGAMPVDSTLTVEPLFESHSAVYARTDHPLALQDSVSLGDLADYGWAMLDGAGFQSAFRQFFIDRDLNPPRQVVLSNSLSYIRQMVQVSPLLTVLPLPFAQDEVNAGLLKKLDVETPAGFVDAVFIHRGSVDRNSALKSLISLIQKQARLERQSQS